ncbi:MAG TPA: translation elongation factor Ts [bacterium]|nr:translation elongation factor Ts [bacterium]
MAAIDAQQVKELREMTGAGMMDCKKALSEPKGNVQEAVDYLRKKGLSAAAKKAERVTKEGLIGHYVHSNGKIAVLVEVGCETDFVARTDDFKALVRDLAMHVAASNPLAVRREEIDPAMVARERDLMTAQVAEMGKPAAVIQKIIEGKLEKWYADNALMEQPFVKDPDRKISDVVSGVIAKLGENIQVRRFVRMALGETQS